MKQLHNGPKYAGKDWLYQEWIKIITRLTMIPRQTGNCIVIHTLDCLIERGRGGGVGMNGGLE